MELRTEVLIIGGGLVGGTMACALGRFGVPCVVVDRDDPSTLIDEGYDGRCSAIALACQRVLDGAGLWRHMADDCQPIEHIRVADGDSLLFLHYDHRDVGDEPMGYMAENRVTRRAIYKQLECLPQVTHLAPHSVVALDRGPDEAVAELEDGRIIRARLVIAAGWSPLPHARERGHPHSRLGLRPGRHRHDRLARTRPSGNGH